MENKFKIEVLDCTLRDGAYVTNGNFSDTTIKNVVMNLSDAGIDIVECGWLKNDIHKIDTSYFHNITDVKKLLKNQNLSIMADYNRYDVSNLENNDGFLDYIRVTFPYEHYKEGIEQGKKIIDKGYKVSFQLVNSKNYVENIDDNFIKAINSVKPYAVSLADTFGSLFPDEIKKLAVSFNNKLDKDIKLGMHTHNNMNLAFANTISFIDALKNGERTIVVDGSLLGMGRGAGNTPTEVLVNFLNKYFGKKYDVDKIYETIDKYISPLKEKYNWGYDSELSVGGITSSHINNISYLKEKGFNSSEIKKILDKLSKSEKNKYDYTLLDKYSKIDK